MLKRDYRLTGPQIEFQFMEAFGHTWLNSLRISQMKHQLDATLWRNKTCTVLHQVGVSFDLYYDARKHKIKIQRKNIAVQLKQL